MSYIFHKQSAIRVTFIIKDKNCYSFHRFIIGVGTLTPVTSLSGSPVKDHLNGSVPVGFWGLVISVVPRWGPTLWVSVRWGCVFFTSVVTLLHPNGPRNPQVEGGVTQVFYSLPSFSDVGSKSQITNGMTQKTTNRLHKPKPILDNRETRKDNEVKPHPYR